MAITNCLKLRSNKEISLMLSILHILSIQKKKGGEDIDAITDPDEYRLLHPFGGMKMNAKTLASTLNGWEDNNSVMYKLE